MATVFSQGVLEIAKRLLHFVGGFEIDLVGAVAHPVAVLDHLAGLDAEEGVVGLGILAAEIVAVVGDDERNAGFAGDGDHLGNCLKLLYRDRDSGFRDRNCRDRKSRRVRERRCTAASVLPVLRFQLTSPLRQAEVAMRPSVCWRRISLSMRGRW